MKIASGEESLVDIDKQKEAAAENFLQQLLFVDFIFLLVRERLPDCC